MFESIREEKWARLVRAWGGRVHVCCRGGRGEEGCRARSKGMRGAKEKRGQSCDLNAKQGLGTTSTYSC